ncbi:uncharacterized protein LOC135083991 [Ostrinia nubilalis]|uniref:uncharacterized protein LOC135083991 n=1 Tax=Ostrinia nubilalis TaxID=29057 RepID=UPI003082212A
MAKYIKSIFQPSETRRTVSYEGSSEEDRTDPPLDGRRKLSISRSGRMRQAQKKRLSLSLEIYGADGENLPTEKPKSVEYHVNPASPPVQTFTNQRRRSGESRGSSDSGKVILRGQGNQVTVVCKENTSPVVTSPDEEIDSAFEIIDKP